MDQHQRKLERDASSGDAEAAAAALRERVRTNELTQEHVELAASLGHQIARVLRPDVDLVDWVEPKRVDRSRARYKSLITATGLVGDTLPARVAADWAERGLRERGKAEHAEDVRPREAVLAARAWANCPCEDHQAAAFAAAEAAEGSAFATDSATAASASSAAAAARPDVSNSAEQAAFSGEQAGGRQAADLLKWQRLRLAAYVLGEV